MICAADGGVLDDLIVYRLADQEFLVVANAANTGVVDSALRERADGHDVRITDQTDAYALIAIQGPAAAGILAPLTDIALDGVKYYTSHQGSVAGREVLLARTGYTGEDGFELFTRPEDAEHVWTTLSGAGAGAGLVPAGLAARDTLRLEAGMPLYGNELGPDTTPFDAGLAGWSSWTSPATSSAGPHSPPRRRRPRAGSWSACALAPGASPGTDIPSCGTGSRAARSPAALPPPRSACPSPWPMSSLRWPQRPGTGTPGRATGTPRTARSRSTSGAGPSQPGWSRCPFTVDRTHNRSHNRP